MPWGYQQATGNFSEPFGALVAKGYSGQPPHANVPTDEGLVNLGPIPCGYWQGVKLEVWNPRLGPYVIVLAPDPATRARVLAYGRDPDSFRVHGERAQPPFGYASDGCIILSRDIRELFWANLDHWILVTE